MDPRLAKIIHNATDPGMVEHARQNAKAALDTFPKDGCAAFLSCYLRVCGILVTVTLGAEELGKRLEARGWERVTEPQAGDVGVCRDGNGNGRADHIFLYLGKTRAGWPIALDNQSLKPHPRGSGKTAVDHWLRGGWVE